MCSSFIPCIVWSYKNHQTLSGVAFEVVADDEFVTDKNLAQLQNFVHKSPNLTFGYQSRS